MKRHGADKKLRSIQRSAGAHWVGDGFPVRTLFAYPNNGNSFSPFLLLDYAGPTEFPATGERRGVGEHPHRGFETVTIVYEGEVEHRDSSGGGGRIGRGDVQWMTAGAGLVHEEFHGRDFSRQGGKFEVVQLWVNLPAKHKMAPPGYQAITSGEIPVVQLPAGHGEVRVIAGALDGAKGPARTFTPIDVWDLRLNAGARTRFELPDGYTTLLVVLKGRIRPEGAEERIDPGEVALFDRVGSGIQIECTEDATALLLCGEPIEEPIAGQGPFVMNTSQEIREAIADYMTGKMGRLS